VPRVRPVPDHHAAPSSLPPLIRVPAGKCWPADEIETSCFACTLEFQGGQWVHERSCPARRRTA
jgi:hypothetical protein